MRKRSMAFGKNANQMQEQVLRVLLGLQPLTTTAYPLRVLPDNLIRRAEPALRKCTFNLEL